MNHHCPHSSLDRLTATNIDRLTATNIDRLTATNIDRLTATNTDRMTATNTDRITATNIDRLSASQTPPLLTMGLFLGVNNSSGRLMWVEPWEDASSSLVSSIAPNMNWGVGYRGWGRGGVRR